MKKTARTAAVLVWLLSVFVPAPAPASQPKPNDPWPAISLPLPPDPIMQHYLGVTKGGAFTVNDIGSEVVVVEIFNMYCPFCQREAPHVNGLFALIDVNADLNRRLKIIGIGVGNSSYEVDFYRRSYSVPFPLFPDRDFNIYNKIGRVRTPHFFVLKRGAGQTFQVVFVHSGGFKSPEAFLAEIVKRCGLK
jgi:thiol-disulfide isomerase/thioredoxin